MMGYGGLNTLVASSMRKGLQPHPAITGTVIEEHYYPPTLLFMDSMYDVCIRTSEGRKVVVSYNSYVSDSSPQFLNSLFATGDKVELQVATKDKYDGKQRFVGLVGKLIEEK